MMFNETFFIWIEVMLSYWWRGAEGVDRRELTSVELKPWWGCLPPFQTQHPWDQSCGRNNLDSRSHGLAHHWGWLSRENAGKMHSWSIFCARSENSYFFYSFIMLITKFDVKMWMRGREKYVECKKAWIENVANLFFYCTEVVLYC